MVIVRTMRAMLSALPSPTIAVLPITTLLVTLFLAVPGAQQAGSTLRPPSFQVDSNWPTIPNNWVLGEVSSIAVGPGDHIWVLHRPASIPADRRANAAPPVLEFDTAGKTDRTYVRRWSIQFLIGPVVADA